MHDLPLLKTIAAGFAAAWVLGVITQGLRLSPIVGYLLAGLLVWLALTADSLAATLFFFAAGTFGVSAVNACEFAMVQRIAPASRIATASGVYNGFAAIVGGGLGPFIVSGIISGGRSAPAILPIVVVCVLASASLTALGRITRY